MTLNSCSPSVSERLGSDVRGNAGQMNLRSVPLSDAARDVVQDFVVSLVVPAWPEGEQVRPTSLEKTRRAVGALLADLLKLEAEGRAGAHGAMRENFTALSFGLNMFIRVRDALVSAGMLEVHLGTQQLTRFVNRHTGKLAKPISRGGQVSRYRLTQAALGRIQAAGVELANWNDHWGRDPLVGPMKIVSLSKAPLVVLRAKGERVYGSTGKGRDLPVDETDPKVAAILRDLAAHTRRFWPPRDPSCA